jgi:hypothetical protein
MSGRSKVGPLSIYLNTVSECKLLAPKCEGVYICVAGIVDKEPPNPTVSILHLLTLTGDIPYCSAYYKGV